MRKAMFGRVVQLLRNWSCHAEQYWYQMPDRPDLGCYGTGYNAWGVQTNQKYVGAMAVLSSYGERYGSIPSQVAAKARERALVALRFSLHSHVSGDYHCTDGAKWGHTWISGLGIERMMHGVYLLEPHFHEKDRAALKRVLVSEADWLLTDYYRGSHKGVVAGQWNSSGKNAPESNLWNGALLWRTSVMYPDHPHVGDWQEQAHRFLVNSVSVPADASDGRIVAGKRVCEWHVGANFFPNYALDHHGYLNVGYMVICLSNAAMLHFDMAAKGLSAPESLYHHLSELWGVLRRMVFSDGRLARIGGDSRLRYTYCQEYLLPSLAFASRVLGDPYAEALLQGQLEWIVQEAGFNNEGESEYRGSFYGRRVADLAEQNPYYYTRLESDRACSLGMVVAYVCEREPGCETSERPEVSAGNLGTHMNGEERAALERSVAGHWCEPEHGVVLHRSSTRLASFAWRAHGLTQGICQSPDDGHLAEWSQNLAGTIRFTGDDGVIQGGQTRHREVLWHNIDTFHGGFVTTGAVLEGANLELAEGWQGARSAVHQIAFAVLPDACTVVGLQYARTVDHRTYVAEVKGLHLNLPNDLFNGFARRLTTSQGEVMLHSPPERDQVLELHSSWAHIEGRVAVVGVYGADQLVVHRSPRRRGGKYRSLYVEEICLHCALGTGAVDPGTIILDVGWAVLSGADQEFTRRFCETCTQILCARSALELRGIGLQGRDGCHYVVVANLSQAEQICQASDLLVDGAAVRDLATGEIYSVESGTTLAFSPCQARAFAFDG